MKRTGLAIAIVALLFSSARSPAGESVSDKAGNEDAIRGLISTWTEAFNRHDVETVSRLFAEDATFVNVYGEMSKGRAEIEKGRADLHKEHFQGTTMATSVREIKFLKEDVARAIVEWTLEVPSVGTFTALSTIVLSSRSGEWTVAAFHNTPVRPPEWRQTTD